MENVRFIGLYPCCGYEAQKAENLESRGYERPDGIMVLISCTSEDATLSPRPQPAADLKYLLKHKAPRRSRKRPASFRCYICTYIYTYLHTQNLHTYIYICIYIHILINTYIYIYMWVCMYICTYIYIYICIYIHMYTHILNMHMPAPR